MTINTPRSCLQEDRLNNNLVRTAWLVRYFDREARGGQGADVIPRAKWLPISCRRQFDLYGNYYSFLRNMGQDNNGNNNDDNSNGHDNWDNNHTMPIKGNGHKNNDSTSANNDGKNNIHSNDIIINKNSTTATPETWDQNIGNC